MKVLLDTTVIIDALKERRNRLIYLDELAAVGTGFFVSAMSVGEVYGGMRPGEEARTAALLATFEILPVDEQIARRAGLLKSTYARKGLTFGLADMIIAATAIAFEIPLFTDNHRHFPMPELTLHPLPPS